MQLTNTLAKPVITNAKCKHTEHFFNKISTELLDKIVLTVSTNLTVFQGKQICSGTRLRGEYLPPANMEETISIVNFCLQVSRPVI
jgi:hypothetical protein